MVWEENAHGDAGISAGAISGLSPTYGNSRFLGLWGPGGGGRRIWISLLIDRGVELKGLMCQLRSECHLIRDTHTHARKNSSENMEGVGEANSSKGTAVRCLEVEDGWRAGLRRLLPRRPGCRRKLLLFWAASQPHCQQAPPLPLASDTIWQKRSCSGKRGLPPTA